MADALKRKPSTLKRKKHIEQLLEGLKGPLSKHYVPSQTWIVYWISHSLALFEQSHHLSAISSEAIKFLTECAHDDGGYGGGPGQIPHLATTFAAINALVTISTEEALESIDRISLVKFLHRMKQPDGSFSMHDDGEVDSRATYCALSILRCLNIHDSMLLENVAEWILSCQTYEGGFGSIPGSEAHGGYTFCCVASLCLLNQLHKADIPSLLRWLTNKQMTEDGGFCGRSNKLVDSCYSYWQGAVFPLIHPQLCKDAQESPETAKETSNGDRKTSGIASSRRRSMRSSSGENRQESADSSKADLNKAAMDKWLMDCGALQDYVLNRCQDSDGLLRDKPGAVPDYYHTCYALSGLSISQHQPDDSVFDLGNQPINLLAPTHPLFNLTFENLNFCFKYFSNKSIQTLEKEETNDV